MECRESRRMVSREVDGRIDGASRERLDRHLESCPECLRFRRAVLAGVSIHRRIAEVSPPPGLVPSIMAAVTMRRPGALLEGWSRVAVPAAAAALAVLGIVTGSFLTDHLSPRNVQNHVDVLELQYLDEYPPGSVGDILMASNAGGSNERE